MEQIINKHTSTMPIPSVSIITSTCYEHRLMFLNLYKSIKEQEYKNIKEWVVYNTTEKADQAHFALFFENFKKKYEADESNKIKLRILNNDKSRCSSTVDCTVLNKLVDESQSEIIVAMTDRDQYSRIRVSSAVNALKKKKIAFSEAEYMYCFEKHPTKLFSMETGVYTRFTAFLAFYKTVVGPQNRFGYNDSIYEDYVGIFDKHYDMNNDVEFIRYDESYIVLNSYSCPPELEKDLRYKKRYSNSLKKSVLHTKQLMSRFMSGCSQIHSTLEEHECPVCFTEAKTVLNACKHPICNTCVGLLRDNRCPLCRDEFSYKIQYYVWNQEYLFGEYHEEE